MKKRLSLFSLFLAALPTLGWAESVSWQSSGTGDWNTAENWSASVPTSADSALIDNSGTAVLGVATNGSADMLFTGSSAQGALLISGGSLSVSAISHLGYDIGSAGSAVVTSGTWSTSELHVGDSGTGSVTISGGLVNVSGTAFLGYNSSGVGTISVSGTLAASAIVAGGGAGSVSIDGGVIKALASSDHFLAASTTLNAAGATINSNGFDIGVTGVLSGTGTLIKEGAGSLILSGENTYTGGTVLNAGTLRLGGFSDPLGEGTFTMNGGTVANDGVGGQTATSNNLSITTDITFEVSGTGGELEFFGDLNLNGATRTLTLTAEGELCFGGIVSNGGINYVATGSSAKASLCGTDDNTFTGPVTVGSGVTLELMKDPGQIAISGDLVVDSGGTILNSVGDQFGPNSNLVLNGDFIDASSGTTTVNVLSGSGRILSDLAALGPSTMVANSGTFSGTILDGDGTQAVVKQGAGVLVLSGSNSYTGGTTVLSGTLRAASNHAFGHGAVNASGGSVVHVDSGIVLDLGAGNKIILQNDGTTAYRKDYAAEEDLAHFNDVTSSGTNATVAQILSGTASAPLTLTASFAAGPEGVAASDTLKLTGSGSDTFVLQLSYNEALAISLFGSEDQAYLGWLDNGVWVNAVNGNAGGSPNFVLGAWNSSYTLGTYGLDTANNTVWAVLNHNSDFAVIPEPSTWLLLGLGLTLVLVFRRRKAA